MSAPQGDSRAIVSLVGLGLLGLMMSSENNGKKQQPASEKKRANVPDADGFISVKEAPAKKNSSERKEQTETTKPAGENGNGTANKKSNVFDLLGEDE